jgi:hypothetical protein
MDPGSRRLRRLGRDDGGGCGFAGLLCSGNGRRKGARCARQKTGKARFNTATAMRRIPVVILVVLIVAAALWAGAWYGASEYAKSSLDQAAAAAASGRPGAECANRRITGFPLRLSIACDATAVVEPVRGIAARLAGLVAEAPFYRPGFVTTDLASPMTVDGPGDIRAEATWRDATVTASAGIWPIGVRHTSGTVENLELKLHGRELPVEAVTVGRGEAGIGASPSVANSLRADVSFVSLKMERSSGRELPEATGEARVDLVGAGGTVTRDLDEQLRVWFATGGKLVVDEAVVVVGGVVLSATGTLEVSPAGLISGDLKVSLAGIDRIADLMETLRPGSRDQAAQVADVLSALARPVETENGPTQRLTSKMSIRDGVVILGFIPLFRLPSVFELAGMGAPSEG